ncbi:MAG: alpha/beta hydrolase fold protein [Herminiimonas sp.]|nr:alpha/beta hydrolase fold protein [Herminiimonas sp.]MDB5856127.1 alpha/beta hydrolase fold protein [Herminiimonas sp.]
MGSSASGTASATGISGLVDLDWNGRMVQVETQWVGVQSSPHPVVVFLHEGLGSVGQWRDFPERFCRANGFRGLVYSRPGYGNSTPRAPGEQWNQDFMHRQANEVLPALLRAVGVTRPWLFGHSDGASIALLYAALAGKGAAEISGVVALAPHVFTEEISVRSIEAVRELYLASVAVDVAVEGGLKSRMARYHADPDSAFWGWNEAWLAPGFRAWNIEADITAITCPVLVVQGKSDEYGTMEQIHRIQRAVPHARALVLADCGHSPQRDQAESVIKEAGSFIIHPA